MTFTKFLKKSLDKKTQEKGQSFLEYALLVGISVIAFLAVISNVLFGPKSVFESHFESAKSAITGE